MALWIMVQAAREGRSFMAQAAALSSNASHIRRASRQILRAQHLGGRAPGDLAARQQQCFRKMSTHEVHVISAANTVRFSSCQRRTSAADPTRSWHRWR